jgi:hypothetical protein
MRGREGKRGEEDKHTDPINRYPLTPPFIHQIDHAPRLAVVRIVEIVVVNVELGIGVCGASGFEGDAHKVLAEHIGEDG